jgi:hypothetical protein
MKTTEKLSPFGHDKCLKSTDELAKVAIEWLKVAGEIYDKEGMTDDWWMARMRAHYVAEMLRGSTK